MTKMPSFLDMDVSTSSKLMTSPCFMEFNDIIKRKEISYAKIKGQPAQNVPVELSPYPMTQSPLRKAGIFCAGLPGFLLMAKTSALNWLSIQLFNFRDKPGPCMLSVFSKTLGYVLIGTMTVSLIPQIIKILRKRSASGVSFFSILLMLEASSSTVAYAIQKRFPVSAWGENLVLMHMNVVLICLLLRYNDKLKTSITFLTIYILFMLLLLWPTVPSQLVWCLYLLSMPAIAASRLIQMYKNHKTKDPGQLSATTAFLCIFQGFGRLTTSIVTTGDDVMIYTFTVVTLLNILLFLQVIYYRRKLKKVS